MDIKYIAPIADPKSPAFNPNAVARPAAPKRHMDAMERWKFDAAYGKALNAKNDDGTFMASGTNSPGNLAQVKELQAILD